MRTRNQRKGIFCIEGLWDLDLRIVSSVRPLLDLLWLNEHIHYIHRDCATRSDCEFYLEKWTRKKYDAYPILYFASHGVENAIKLGPDEYPVQEIAETLDSRCRGRLIMFSSCNTIAVALGHLRAFLEKTGALAVCGYRIDVDWMRATAFELLLLREMQSHEFSRRGIRSIKSAAGEMARAFPDLDFRMVTVRDLDR
jgi:hypothetical protein